MAWYAAHVVMVFRLTRHAQTEWHAWENVILIEADSPRQARDKAALQGKQNESDDDSVTMRGRPAVLEFAGVRKVVACVSDPGDGMEVTYGELDFSSREQLDRFLDGKEATLTVCEREKDE
jgi:hypothetical protein